MDPPMLSHVLPCSPDALSHHKTDGRKTLFMSILPALPDGRTDGPVVLFPPRSSVYCVQGVRNTTCLVGVTTLKTVHVVRTKCTGGPQQFACFVFFRSIMPWQSLPPFLIMVGAIGVMGGAQYGIHYLFNGETRKIGKDRFDMINKWRDNNIKMQQEASAAASGSGHH
jgi:NADH dehydrogenase (ubiquinone) 1 alpha subcomplex subunit 1